MASHHTAHPERYLKVQQDIDIASWVDKGYILQINCGSITEILV